MRLALENPMTKKAAHLDGQRRPRSGPVSAETIEAIAVALERDVARLRTLARYFAREFGEGVINMDGPEGWLDSQTTIDGWLRRAKAAMANHGFDLIDYSPRDVSNRSEMVSGDETPRNAPKSKGKDKTKE